MKNTPDKENESHTVIDNGRLKCLHCGDTNSPELPMELRKFCARLNDFAARHKDCPKPESSHESRMRYLSVNPSPEKNLQEKV